jgi:hypothetical protein
MSSDDSLSRGTSGFRMAGTGLATTRNCLPGDHNLMQTVGGRWIRYRGVRCWACTTCAERIDAKRAQKEAA